MVLKRKRSDSEISTASSILSSPLSSANFMSIDSLQTPQTPSLFSSRTRKRHRDNRPDENAVHQHTLSLLFSAQQKPQSQPEPQPQLHQSQFGSFHPQGPVPSLPSTHVCSQQSSLHSFWAIPAARYSSPSSSSWVSSNNNTPTATDLLTQYFQPTNCEDCDASLGQDGDAMDVDTMMDVDMGGDRGSHGCESCGKQVCHSCAVSNLGKERKCLMCAGKETENKWEGGRGWVPKEDSFERGRTCMLAKEQKWTGAVLPTSFRRSAWC